MLGESFLSKRTTSGVTPISPSSFEFKAAEAIALTVPAKLTAVQEFFKGRHIHQTLIGFLLNILGALLRVVLAVEQKLGWRMDARTLFFQNLRQVVASAAAGKGVVKA